jgi:hypothetical protein
MDQKKNVAPSVDAIKNALKVRSDLRAGFHGIRMQPDCHGCGRSA